MIDLVRKTFLIGLGAASMTADHLKAMLDDLQSQGKLNREEAEKLAREMAIKTSEQMKALAAELEAEGKLTKEEIERLAMEMAARTAEQVKKLSEELRERSILSMEDAEKFAKEAATRAESARREIESRASDAFAEIIKRLKLVTKEEYDALAARVAALEAKLEKPAE